jgi:hypothetical protein
MNGRKGLVLDANILIRAVFGQRVRQILEAYENVAIFCSPDVCFQDARKYIPNLSARRGFDSSVGLSVLEEIGRVVEPVDRSLYEDFENLARERVLTRDPEDWPIVAAALLLEFPDLDRRSGFLWQRCRYLDHGQSRVVSTLNRETKYRTAFLPSEEAANRAFAFIRAWGLRWRSGFTPYRLFSRVFVII